MSKVTKELSDAIYNRYLELKAEGKYKKTFIQEILRNEFGLKRTTTFDHSRGRELQTVDYKAFKDVEVVVEPIEEKWEPLIKSMPTIEYKSYNSKTYIITGYEVRVGINESFLKCIEHLKKELNAEALLVPIWHKDSEFIPNRLKEIFTVVDTNIKFNDNLSLEYVPTHALVQSPLSGWAGAFPGKSVILPGLIKELISEPSIHTCKQLLTTGSVGYLDANYEQFDRTENVDFRKRWYNVTNRATGKTTAIAQRFIRPTALIVNVIDEKIFLTRYITMEQEGVVYDLDKKITPRGIVQNQPLALVCGDHHAYSVDKKIHKACLGMINRFNPKEVFVNDFFDGISVNHHIASDANLYTQSPSIVEEAKVTKALLKEITDISNRVVYLHSNHDNFLTKLLAKGIDYWKMNGNLSMCYRLQAYTMDTGKHPIIELLELENIPNLYFSNENEIYHVKDVAVMHGHESFGKLAFKGFSRVYNKIVIGHEHKPQLFRNAVCVGATATAEMSYSIGVNASMGANCLIQPDGSLQLLPIIEGKWM